MPTSAQLQREILAAHGADHLAARATMLAQNPRDLHVSRPLTDMAVRYENAEYIADKVWPVVQIPKMADDFFVFDPKMMFTPAQAAMTGQRARPNQIEYTQTLDTFSTRNYGLLDFVSAEEQDNADAPLEPLMTSTEVVTNALLLMREMRVAAKVFDPTGYARTLTGQAPNVITVAGGSRFDDAAADIPTLFDTAIRSCLQRPTHLVIGANEWDLLRSNASLKAHILSRAATAEGATPLRVDEATVAAAFRLKGIIIGDAKVNTGAEGAAAAFSYIWGNRRCALIRIEPSPNKRRTATHGYTFRYTPKGASPMTAQEIPEILAGAYGGTWVKVVHSDDEKAVGGGYTGVMLDTCVN